MLMFATQLFLGHAQYSALARGKLRKTYLSSPFPIKCVIYVYIYVYVYIHMYICYVLMFRLFTL